MKVAHPSRTRAEPLSADVMEEIDPGIRRAVAWLRELGFDTCDSGDGRSKAQWIAEGEALAHPHVVARVEPEAMVSEIDRLADAMRRMLHVEVASMGPEQQRGTVTITGSYDAGNRIAVIMVDGLDDSLLAKALDPTPPDPGRHA